MRRASHLAAFAFVVLGLAGCDVQAEPVEAPETSDVGEATDSGQAAPDPGRAPEIVDGVVRARGVVVPVPDGWILDDLSVEEGIVGLIPDGDEPRELILAASGIADTGAFGVRDEDFEGAVEAFRAFGGGTADVDEPVEVDGADRAHLLRFDDIEAREGFEHTTDVVVIAEDDAGRLALFTYAATVGSFDEQVLALLLAHAAMDADTDPVPLDE